METLTRTRERGSVLVHVVIAIIALVAISALTIDAGVKWVARGQAQNAADAGALAGAVALSFDDPDDLTDTGAAKQSARNYALANLVWGESADVQLSTDVTFPTCPDLSADTCVKVDVYRNQERPDYALPTFSARLVRVLEQGVKATATAQVRTGNATNCLKPWAVIDRWDEFDGPEPDYPGADPDWLPTSTFDLYSSGQGNSPPPEPDLYVPPTANSPGTGWTLDDSGRQFAIKTGAPGNDAFSSGWFRQIDLPRTDGNNLGGEAYGENIVSCNGYPTAIADPGQVCPDPGDINSLQQKIDWAARGCVRVQTGVDQGNTRSGIREVFALDPGARWSPSMNDGRGGVANSCCTPSPRIVPVAIMDVGAYQSAYPSGSGGVVKIVNIFGFFIEGMGDLDANGNIIFDPADPLRINNQVVIGRLMTLPGMATGSSTITSNAAFLRTILLVR